MTNNGVSSASSHVIEISDDPNHLAAGDSDTATNGENLPTEDEEIDMMVKKDDECSSKRRALTEDCCIFRVPERLKHENTPAFVPSVISIGPFHHGSDGMRSMEEQKWMYLSSLLSRHCFNGRIGLGELLCAMKPLEERIKRSYSETIGMERIKLMEMMVLDGCFIIEFFLRLIKPRIFQAKDSRLHKPWFIAQVKRDLLKLENQIPFFVLETLHHNLCLSSSSKLPHLITLALEVLRYPFEFYKKPDAFTGLEVKHLLDLYCLDLTPSSSLPTDHRNKISEWKFSAQKFQQAGAIAFQVGDSSDSLLDIKFVKRSGTIKIPALTVDNFIKLVFFNALAFEQAYMHRARYMTSYVNFMGVLVQSREDVHLLRGCSVIRNHLGTDKEVVRLFNGMRKDMIMLPDCRYLGQVFSDVEQFADTKWAKFYSFWAELWDTYFRSPWAFISFLGVLAAFVLTALQTTYTIHPPN